MIKELLSELGDNAVKLGTAVAKRTIDSTEIGIQAARSSGERSFLRPVPPGQGLLYGLRDIPAFRSEALKDNDAELSEVFATQLSWLLTHINKSGLTEPQLAKMLSGLEKYLTQWAEANQDEESLTHAINIVVQVIKVAYEEKVGTKFKTKSRSSNLLIQIDLWLYQDSPLIVGLRQSLVGGKDTASAEQVRDQAIKSTSIFPLGALAQAVSGMWDPQPAGGEGSQGLHRLIGIGNKRHLPEEYRNFLTLALRLRPILDITETTIASEIAKIITSLEIGTWSLFHKVQRKIADKPREVLMHLLVACLSGLSPESTSRFLALWATASDLSKELTVATTKLPAYKAPFRPRLHPSVAQTPVGRALATGMQQLVNTPLCTVDMPVTLASIPPMVARIISGQLGVAKKPEIAEQLIPFRSTAAEGQAAQVEMQSIARVYHRAVIGLQELYQKIENHTSSSNAEFILLLYFLVELLTPKKSEREDDKIVARAELGKFIIEVYQTHDEAKTVFDPALAQIQAYWPPDAVASMARTHLMSAAAKLSFQDITALHELDFELLYRLTSFDQTLLAAVPAPQSQKKELLQQQRVGEMLVALLGEILEKHAGPCISGPLLRGLIAAGGLDPHHRLLRKPDGDHAITYTNGEIVLASAAQTQTPDDTNTFALSPHHDSGVSFILEGILLQIRRFLLKSGADQNDCNLQAFWKVLRTRLAQELYAQVMGVTPVDVSELIEATEAARARITTVLDMEIARIKATKADLRTEVIALQTKLFDDTAELAKKIRASAKDARSNNRAEYLKLVATIVTQLAAKTPVELSGFFMRLREVGELGMHDETMRDLMARAEKMTKELDGLLQEDQLLLETSLGVIQQNTAAIEQQIAPLVARITALDLKQANLQTQSDDTAGHALAATLEMIQMQNRQELGVAQTQFATTIIGPKLLGDFLPEQKQIATSGS